MNHALRSRHRWMTSAMAVVALGGLATGLLARPAPATMSALPTPLQNTLAPSESVPLLQGADLWDGAEIDTTIYPDQVVLTVREPLRAPAPLLYQASAPSPTGVPDDARLLGTMSGEPDQRFPLPSTGGTLIIFSLGHGTVLATLSLESR
jgi:hypothetical protein